MAVYVSDGGRAHIDQAEQASPDTGNAKRREIASM